MGICHTNLNRQFWCILHVVSMLFGVYYNLMSNSFGLNHPLFGKVRLVEINHLCNWASISGRGHLSWNANRSFVKSIPITIMTTHSIEIIRLNNWTSKSDNKKINQQTISMIKSRHVQGTSNNFKLLTTEKSVGFQGVCHVPTFNFQLQHRFTSRLWISLPSGRRSSTSAMASALRNEPREAGVTHKQP